ncbi:MAG: cytochrome c biogenesis protein ResB [Elusimicrobia bacterium]|nr:cytochrome c biogenesis protein ResB [Elusimicrobiota bacterium]
MMNPKWRRWAILRVLTSLELTIACLATMIVLVFLCTLAQVHLGIFEAVKLYIRSFFVYWPVFGSTIKIPIMPGGALVGLVLLVNLVCAQWARLELSWRKVGLWLVHLGLMLLFGGEFVSGMFQIETQMPIEEGQTTNYSESLTQFEMVLVDRSHPEYDDVISIPDARLQKRGVINDHTLPVTIVVKKYYLNSSVAIKHQPQTAEATMGVGVGMDIQEAPAITTDDRINEPSALVEIQKDGITVGVWWLSTALGAPQSVSIGTKSYQLALRQRRYYLPFSLTLKDFRHDVYPGTDIPKNFSSLVRLRDRKQGENRDVLIYMNHPLRYAGRAFFQASFGKEDTLSVLQVVENPGWLIPYIACVLVTLGLAAHFYLFWRHHWTARSA